jgi:hypothetical protein
MSSILYTVVCRVRASSGRNEMETDVIGQILALPYGSRANWLRNVLANVSATLVHDGHTYLVDRPEVVPMRAVEACFSASDRRNHRLFGVDECLRVRKAAAEPAA